MQTQTVSLPHQILKGSHCLDNVFSSLSDSLQRVFIVAGKTALSVTLPTLQRVKGSRELTDSWYGGEVTEVNMKRLSEQAKRAGADVIFAIGGGKAIDMGKWVADDLQLPVVTIPTIAATCAASSTVTVMYDESGHYMGMKQLAKAPLALVIDADILAHAPPRWLSAGLGDTLAKLYEFRAIADNLPKCSFNYSAYSNGRLCYDLIRDYGEQAMQDNAKQQASDALEGAADAIVLFAGFTSIMGVGDHVAASHALFDGFTTNPKTRDFGHGLLVGFGNLVLQVLEGRTDAEILAEIDLAKRCGIPVTLADIAELTETELFDIATASVNTSDMGNMPRTISAQELVDAIHYVSALSGQLG
ncbi:iron-containing alcohol dehydrogenase family protein [Vibrio sp. H11]|uniref:iron-containing alcohol dehydrogenase family protein n=1 Tax=Vibrio sp. H11 TaxID=2565928 RepID=UPI00145619D3|nr:iron-containing alcohol dehydrogenase family protein [Vibrio sp. H11]